MTILTPVKTPITINSYDSFALEKGEAIALLRKWSKGIVLNKSFRLNRLMFAQVEMMSAIRQLMQIHQLTKARVANPSSTGKIPGTGKEVIVVLFERTVYAFGSLTQLYHEKKQGISNPNTQKNRMRECTAYVKEINGSLRILFFLNTIKKRTRFKQIQTHLTKVKMGAALLHSVLTTPEVLHEGLKTIDGTQWPRSTLVSIMKEAISNAKISLTLWKETLLAPQVLQKMSENLTHLNQSPNIPTVTFFSKSLIKQIDEIEKFSEQRIKLLARFKKSFLRSKTPQRESSLEEIGDYHPSYFLAMQHFITLYERCNTEEYSYLIVGPKAFKNNHELLKLIINKLKMLKLPPELAQEIKSISLSSLHDHYWYAWRRCCQATLWLPLMISSYLKVTAAAIKKYELQPINAFLKSNISQCPGSQSFYLRPLDLYLQKAYQSTDPNGLRLLGDTLNLIQQIAHKAQSSRYKGLTTEEIDELDDIFATAKSCIQSIKGEVIAQELVNLFESCRPSVIISFLTQPLGSEEKLSPNEGRFFSQHLSLDFQMLKKAMGKGKLTKLVNALRNKGEESPLYETLAGGFEILQQICSALFGLKSSLEERSKDWKNHPKKIPSDLKPYFEIKNKQQTPEFVELMDQTILNLRKNLKGNILVEFDRFFAYWNIHSLLAISFHQVYQLAPEFKTKSGKSKKQSPPKAKTKPILKKTIESKLKNTSPDTLKPSPTTKQLPATPYQKDCALLTNFGPPPAVKNQTPSWKYDEKAQMVIHGAKRICFRLAFGEENLSQVDLSLILEDTVQIDRCLEGKAPFYRHDVLGHARQVASHLIPAMNQVPKTLKQDYHSGKTSDATNVKEVLNGCRSIWAKKRKRTSIAPKKKGLAKAVETLAKYRRVTGETIFLNYTVKPHQVKNPLLYVTRKVEAAQRMVQAALHEALGQQDDDHYVDSLWRRLERNDPYIEKRLQLFRGDLRYPYPNKTWLTNLLQETFSATEEFLTLEEHKQKKHSTEVLVGRADTLMEIAKELSERIRNPNQLTTNSE